MDKITDLFQKSYNIDSEVVCFPIRHHSPACAYHVKKSIEIYQPELILIEGLEESNEVMDILKSEESICPIATYHSYVDKKGSIGEKNEIYRMYTPYMDSSPELAAIRHGASMGIESVFIDMPLPYHLYSFEDSFDRASYEKNILFHNKYIESLCVKEACDNLDELWEKLFELDYREKSHMDFVRELFCYGYLTREGRSGQNDEANSLRERYMASKVEEYKKQYKKILVITGAYHTSALLTKQKNFKEPFSYTKGNLNIYPISYSFEKMDSRRGYSSGMEFPNYYNEVYKKSNYDEIAKKFILSTLKRLKEEKEGLSTADGIEAYYMAKELSKLRNKKNIGVNEIQEGVKAAFIKGEWNEARSKPMEVLYWKLVGKQVGQISSSAKIPPVISDFRKKLKELGFNLNTLMKKELRLEIYRKEKDRKISNFLHTMVFLGTSFANIRNQRRLIDTESSNKMTEIWSLKWSPEIERELLDISPHGSTLSEAAESIFVKKINKSNRISEGSFLLLSLYQCGINTLGREINNKILELMEKDDSFFSHAKGLNSFYYLYNIISLLGIEKEEKIDNYIRQTAKKAVYLLSGIDNILEEENEHFGQAVNSLHYLSQKEEKWVAEDILGETLEFLGETIESPYGKGIISAFLYNLQRIKIDEIFYSFEGYIKGFAKVEGLMFMQGIFEYSRDLLFVSDAFIKILDEIVRDLEETEFMNLLPGFRKLFTFFTPLEIDKIAGKIGGLYEEDRNEIIYREALNENTLRFAIETDKQAREKLEFIYGKN